MTFNFVHSPPEIGNIISSRNWRGQKVYFLVLDVTSKVKFGPGRMPYYGLKLFNLDEQTLFKARWLSGANIEWINESLTVR